MATEMVQATGLASIMARSSARISTECRRWHLQSCEHVPSPLSSPQLGLALQSRVQIIPAKKTPATPGSIRPNSCRCQRMRERYFLNIHR
jgi:hypothetical protein